MIWTNNQTNKQARNQVNNHCNVQILCMDMVSGKMTWKLGSMAANGCKIKFGTQIVAGGTVHQQTACVDGSHSSYTCLFNSLRRIGNWGKVRYFNVYISLGSNKQILGARNLQLLAPFQTRKSQVMSKQRIVLDRLQVHNTTPPHRKLTW